MAQGMAEYSVGRPTGVCAASGRTLAPGEAYVGTLIEQTGNQDGVPKLSMVRQDYSLEAWESGARPKARVLGSWRGLYSPAPARRAALMSDAELLDLFEQVAGSSEGTPMREGSEVGRAEDGVAAGASPSRIGAFRYVLTLLLVRKRLLRMAGERRVGQAGGPALLVAHRGDTSGTTIAIPDPGLDDATLAEVIEQIGAVIGGEEGGGGGA